MGLTAHCSDAVVVPLLHKVCQGSIYLRHEYSMEKKQVQFTVLAEEFIFFQENKYTSEKYETTRLVSRQRRSMCLLCTLLHAMKLPDYFLYSRVTSTFSISCTYSHPHVLPFQHALHTIVHEDRWNVPFLHIEYK